MRSAAWPRRRRQRATRLLRPTTGNMSPVPVERVFWIASTYGFSSKDCEFVALFNADTDRGVSRLCCGSRGRDASSKLRSGTQRFEFGPLLLLWSEGALIGYQPDSRGNHTAALQYVKRRDADSGLGRPKISATPRSGRSAGTRGAREQARTDLLGYWSSQSPTIGVEGVDPYPKTRSAAPGVFEFRRKNEPVTAS